MQQHHKGVMNLYELEEMSALNQVENIAEKVIASI
jgi:hypothetical protein